MKKVGIWIDRRKAKIISIEEEKEHIETIMSNIEDFHVKGGSGGKHKGGPQDVVQDSKYLERKKHQLATFFKKIISHLKDVEAIVIFGPAQTGAKLNNELITSHALFRDKIKSVEKADSMTDNQLVAWVRNYYL